jgi:hypothetical protein
VDREIAGQRLAAADDVVEHDEERLADDRAPDAEAGRIPLDRVADAGAARGGEIGLEAERVGARAWLTEQQHAAARARGEVDRRTTADAELGEELEATEVALRGGTHGRRHDEAGPRRQRRGA